MLAMHKLTRFHWNIGKFCMFMILRMMLDVDDSFVGMFFLFNWNVSWMCIFITILCMDSENIMIWNPDDDRWQELGGLVDVAITNFKPEFKTWQSGEIPWKKCKGMWSTPGILPHPQTNWWMKPSIRNSRDSIRWWSVTTWIPGWKPGGFHVPFAALRFAYNPSARHIHFWWGDVCIVNGHSEHEQTWHQRQIYCWWFRNPANSPVDIWLIHPRLFGISSINSILDSHWVLIALLRKIVYFFCWSCEIKKLPSMCC